MSMTVEQYLLTCIAEECSEVAQAVSKAVRFGINDKSPATGEANCDAITREIGDLFAAIIELEKYLQIDLILTAGKIAGSRGVHANRMLGYAVARGQVEP